MSGAFTPAIISVLLNVQAFGAVGDGVTDDSTAVQAALDAAAGATAPGAVYFPPGTYKIAVTVPQWVSLIGARSPGRVEAFVGLEQVVTGVTRITPASNTTPAIKITSCLGQSIRAMRIDGPGAYVASSCGIRVAKDNGNFAGTGLYMEGVEVRDFETGVLYLANRGYFEHCSFMSCLYGFRAQTSADFLPSDTLTFINCSGGGAMMVSDGVYQTPGSRTNYGWHLNGNIKGASFIGCEMGQCGTAIRIESCLGVVVSGSNFEGNDTIAITMTSGHLVVEGTNSFSETLPFIYATETSNITSISIRNCVISTTYEAIVKLRDQNLRPEITPPNVIEYVNVSDVRQGLMLSSGESITATRITSDQTISPGNSAAVVVFNSVTGTYTGNFNTSNGEWKCPRAGRYRFRMRLKTGGIATWSEWYIGGSTASGGALVDGGFVKKRIDALNSFDHIEGEVELFCTQGWFYRLYANSGAATDFTIQVGSEAVTGAPECQWIIEEAKKNQ